MGAMLTMADLHLLPQIAEVADLVLPSKLSNILASGRPEVATSDSGTRLNAEVDGCGLIPHPAMLRRWPRQSAHFLAIRRGARS